MNKEAKAFPMWKERFGMLFIIASAIMLSRWLFQQNQWPDSLTWILSICVLPLVVLILAEGLGRFIQKHA
ncbi:MAG TPA: hypothetical protein EYQ85_01495 [Candidatus Poseidoniales archaeon]|nr:hypothetical protein [Candidatus Poseidoniales archaeon]